MRIILALLLFWLPISEAQIILVVKKPAGGGGLGAFSDDFDRADSDSLGANWTEAAGDGDIFSNSYRIGTGSFGVVTSIHNTSTGSTTQYVKVTLNAALTQYPWLAFRYTNSGGPYYVFQLDGNNGEVNWLKYDNAADTVGDTIGSIIDIGGTFGSETLCITITGTGSNTDVRVWRGCTGLPSAADNWNGDTTPDGTWLTTDPGGSAVDSGNFVGIGGQASPANTVRLEDFFGGGL